MENNTPAQLKQDLEAIADLLKRHLQQDDRILAHKTQTPKPKPLSPPSP